MTDYPKTKDWKNTRISFSLSPVESMLLFISDKKFKGYEQQVDARDVKQVATKSGIVVKRDNPNVLPIDFCDLQIADKSIKDIHVSEACNTVYTQYGFANGNPWNHSVQYKSSIMDRSGFDNNSGFVATYKFTINGQFDISNIKAVVERPEIWKVSVNGHQI